MLSSVQASRILRIFDFGWRIRSCRMRRMCYWIWNRDVTMNNEVVDGQRQVGVLYGFDSSDRSNAVLSAIGLTASDAHKNENGVNYYTSDTLNNKLAAALAANAASAKNALETAVKNGGVAMTETDVTGHTSASNMEQGLYLVVETRVPEMVTSTCNPFFVSLPMTTIDGADWNYDVTVYPKNQTGNPDLEKTVREDKNSTGKNTGSLTDITDGKDLVTLVTCTPFGINTHRLLVRGHRVPYTPEQASAAEEKPVASSWTQHYLTGLAIGLGVVAVIGGGYALIRRKRHA